MAREFRVFANLPHTVDSPLSAITAFGHRATIITFTDLLGLRTFVRAYCTLPDYQWPLRLVDISACPSEALHEIPQLSSVGALTVHEHVWSALSEASLMPLGSTICGIHFVDRQVTSIEALQAFEMGIGRLPFNFGSQLGSLTGLRTLILAYDFPLSIPSDLLL